MVEGKILTLLPAVVGPTASGKTALSLALGRRLGCEIVCCDSMQIYRGMDIGTAKPDAAERAVLPHHMLDLVPPGTPYSAADYARDALACIREILSRGRLPLLCGGTGLYLSALRRGAAPSSPVPGDPALREALRRRAAEPGGADALYAELAAVDPVSAQATHPNNLRRVIRALEIYRKSGKPKSEWDRLSRAAEQAVPVLPIRIRYADRALLADRIAARVRSMLHAGLAEEVSRLLADGALSDGSTAAQAIGYKELLPYLRGQCTLSEAEEELTVATRRYAKRQMTWFGADPTVRWLTADREDGTLRPTEALAEEAEALYRAAVREWQTAGVVHA